MSTGLIHCTDLFRPHEDPDDHWDLATSFALAHTGLLDLHAVVIDCPPERHRGRPDMAAVAQMNHITGLNVACAVGETAAGAGPGISPGTRLMLDVLERARSPVAILIGGGCATVARAVILARDLFAQKCAAVYLNAGSGTRDPALIAEAEYNVRLDAAAFAAMFELPCPLYWMPCFEITPPRWTVETFGTWYCFRQSDGLANLGPRMCNFFLSMLEKRDGEKWREQLDEPPDHESLRHFGELYRNMWCTAGFFHAAGWSVTLDGGLVRSDGSAENAVYRFDPISAECLPDGIVLWKPESDRRRQFIFRVADTDHYQKAMTTALRALLLQLPR